jgi:hypothetical protein
VIVSMIPTMTWSMSYRRSAARYRRMLVVYNPEKRLHWLQLVIWRLPFDKLNDCTPNTPDVRRSSGPRELNDFWCHPIWCTNNTRLVQAGLLRGDTKVGQLDQALFRCENVCTLDIPMYDTLLVEVEEAMEDLGHVESDEVFRKLAEVLANAVQRPVLTVPASSISPLHFDDFLNLEKW